MALPMVVKYNMKFLAEEAHQRARLRRSASVQVDFGFDNRRFLAVPLHDYLNHLPFVHSLVKETDAMARLPSEEKRLAAFNKKFADSFVDKNVLTAFLIEWKRQKEIKSLQKPESDLLDAFFRRSLLLTDLPQGLKKLYINKLIIVDFDRDLKEAVYNLQTELDRQELISDTVSAVAPRVTLAVAGLFPPTAVPIVIGFAFEGLVGLLEFFAFMADAEADDYISEEEAEEAWWQLAGILPFSLVGRVLLARAGLQIGIALFEMLIAALEALPDLLGNWRLALDEGWDNFGDMDPKSEIFIPSYAVNDLRRVNG